MALGKVITNARSGVTSTYWRLVSIHLDSLNRRGHLELAGYVSADIRQQPDGVPVDRRLFEISQSGFDQLAAIHTSGTVFGVIASAAYGFIKTAQSRGESGEMVGPEFADAEDV